jgi:hypothetical protein
VKAERSATAEAVRSVVDAARLELDEARATWAAGEPLRRERWLERKTREVREM